MPIKRSRVYTPPRRRSAPTPRRVKKPAPRRQYVKLRTRQRKEISRKMSGVMKRALIVVAALALCGLFVWHSHDWVQRQLDRHTPALDLKAPADLTGLPVFSVLPKRRWLLWLPGVPTVAQRRMERQFPALWHARIENHFFENRIVIYLAPRVPLVQCKEQFMDGEGVFFALSGFTKALPQMTRMAAPPAKNVGPWLLALSRIPWLWDDLAELKENSLGEWTLVMRSEQVFLWGVSDENVVAKAEILQKIIGRAQDDHGGALRADLRFFREGRIIVQVRRTLHA